MVEESVGRGQWLESEALPEKVIDNLDLLDVADLEADEFGQSRSEEIEQFIPFSWLGRELVCDESKGAKQADGRWPILHLGAFFSNAEVTFNFSYQLFVRPLFLVTLLYF